jgi:hypothetical protein
MVNLSSPQGPQVSANLPSRLSDAHGLGDYKAVGECPENSPYLHRRIDRAYTRMIAANTPEWAHRWGDAFVTYVRARNAQRTPREVAELEKRMGLR